MRMEIDAKIILTCVTSENTEEVRGNVVLSAEQILNSIQVFKVQIPVDTFLPLVGVRVHFDSDSCEKAIKEEYETEAAQD